MKNKREKFHKDLKTLLTTYEAEISFKQSWTGDTKWLEVHFVNDENQTESLVYTNFISARSKLKLNTFYTED